MWWDGWRRVAQTAELRVSTRQINGGSYHRAAGLWLVARLLAKRKRTHGTASKSKPARVMTYVLFWWCLASSCSSIEIMFTPSNSPSGNRQIKPIERHHQEYQCRRQGFKCERERCTRIWIIVIEVWEWYIYRVSERRWPADVLEIFMHARILSKLKKRHHWWWWWWPGLAN